jgi:hypothetical protein
MNNFVYYCNTDFDISFTTQITKKISRITDPMTLLFLALGKENDIILTKSEPTKDYILYLQQSGINIGTIIPIQNYSHSTNNTPVVWGWNKETISLFNNYNVTLNIMKNINSKIFSMNIENEILENYSRRINSFKQIVDCMKYFEYPILVKPVFSSSAYNSVYLDSHEKLYSHKQHIENMVINEALVEKYHQRFFDFSYGNGYTENKLIDFRILENSQTGEFQSITYSVSHNSIPEYINYNTLKTVLVHTTEKLKSITYNGIFGIDGYCFFQNNNIKTRYMCELNCRMTMADILKVLIKKFSCKCGRILSLKSNRIKNFRNYQDLFGAKTFHRNDAYGILFLTPVSVIWKGGVIQPVRVFFFYAAKH